MEPSGPRALAWSDVQAQWLALLAHALAQAPYSGGGAAGAAGVRSVLTFTSSLLLARGFTVEHHPDDAPNGVGLLIATRAPRGGCPHTVGLFGHVDVEAVEACVPWASADSRVPELLDGRWYCRGIADNLGPLLARVLAFRADDARSAGVVWVIQGEEEIGSPFAHAVLPALKASVCSGVMLWVEETGYFTADGAQRILTMHDAQGDAARQPIVDFALHALAAHAGGRAASVSKRFLNKSFGSNRCPCIAHLVDGSVPYISFGINDVRSRIHDVNESVPADTLSLAFEQFKAVLSLGAAAADPPPHPLQTSA